MLTPELDSMEASEVSACDMLDMDMDTDPARSTPLLWRRRMLDDLRLPGPALCREADLPRLAAEACRFLMLAMDWALDGTLLGGPLMAPCWRNILFGTKGSCLKPWMPLGRPAEADMGSPLHLPDMIRDTQHTVSTMPIATPVAPTISHASTLSCQGFQNGKSDSSLIMQNFLLRARALPMSQTHTYPFEAFPMTQRSAPFTVLQSAVPLHLLVVNLVLLYVRQLDRSCMALVLERHSHVPFEHWLPATHSALLTHFSPSLTVGWTVVLALPVVFRPAHGHSKVTNTTAATTADLIGATRGFKKKKTPKKRHTRQKKSLLFVFVFCFFF